MNPAFGVAAAAAFVWLGMVLAISFIEAPLKFRAPGVTLAIGLGIGRLVFRALNVCEVVLAAAMLTSFAIRPPGMAAGVAAGVAVVALLAQVLAVRPVLPGDPRPRSPGPRVPVAGALGLRRSGDRQSHRPAHHGCLILAA